MEGNIELLCETCVVVEGFPASRSAQVVASDAVKVIQVRVFRAARAEGRSDTAWVLQLASHDEQRRCLQNYSAFKVTADGNEYEIKLSYPAIRSLPANQKKWTAVQTPDRYEFVDPEDMFTDPSDDAPGCAPGAPPLPPKPKLEVPQGPNTLPDRKSSSGSPGREKDDSFRTVQFELQRTPLNPDVFWQYFKSPSSGGGDVEAVTTHAEKRIVHITFTTVESAQRVAGREHAIDGETVKVRMCLPPRSRPKYPDLLMFQNVPEDTALSNLTRFLEDVSKGKPLAILYGDDPGVIAVTFDKQLDYATVQKKCQERLLGDRVRLAVSQVPMSGSILVEDLCPQTCEGTVKLHFGNKGGIVKDVVMFEDGSNRCIVDFQDLAVAQNVVKTSHTIDNQQVRVKVYLECLGHSGGTADPSIISLPPPIILKDTKKYEAILIRDCPAVAEEFSKRLDRVHAKLILSQEMMNFECTINSNTPNPRQTAQSWSDNVQKIVSEFLDQIRVFDVRIHRHVWSEVAEELSVESVPAKSHAVFMLAPKDAKCVVVGILGTAYKLYQRISDIVRAAEQKAHRKGQLVTETYSKLKLVELHLLKARSFDEEMMRRYDDLTVDIDVQKQLVTIHGARPDVKMVISEIDSLVKSIKCTKLGKLSDCQKGALSTPGCAHVIEIQFTSSDVTAIWEKGKKDDIHVYAFSDADCREAARIMLEAVFEDEIKMDSTDSGDWLVCAKSYMDRNPGALWVTLLDDKRKIIITGSKGIVQEVKAELCRVLKTGNLYTETVRFSSSSQKFISQFRQREIKAVESALQKDKVFISLVNEGREISITGSKEGVRIAKQKLQEMVRQQTVCHEQKLSDRAELKFLKSKHCRRELNGIERQHKCVISLQREAPGLVDATDLQRTENTGLDNGTYAEIILPVNDGQQHCRAAYAFGNPSGTSHPGAVGGARAATKPNDQPTIASIVVYILEGEIAKEKADVIVNTTSSNLDLTSGAVSLSILKGADFSLQTELTSKYPRGVGMWEIARTGGHGLACAEVFHLVLGVWSKEAAQSLRRIIRACLEEASKSGYKSIAFPALGTGKLQYPREQVAQTMFSVVDEFRRDTSTTSLSEVRITLYQQDMRTVQIFRRVEKQLATGQNGQVSTRVHQPVTVHPDAFSTPGVPKIRVSIVDGQLASQQVDVIINTASSDLDLSKGAVSSSILRVAGSSLQDELKSKYPSGILPGQIAFTKGHGLQCREVYHLALGPWSAGMKETLSSVLFACAESASEKKYASIALPALGTRQLGYPREQVAQTMFSFFLDSFVDVMPTTTLREVKIVVYQDQQTLQAFYDAERKTTGAAVGRVTSPTTRNVPPSSPAVFQHRDFSTSRVGPIERENVVKANFDMRGLRVEIVKGELTNQEVDVIVVTANGQRQIADGNVRSVLRRMSGNQIERDLQAKAGDFQKRGLALTLGYKMRCKRILFVNTDRFGHDLERCIFKCLKEADILMIKTLAIPPLGAGVDNSHLTSKALYKALNMLSKDRQHVQVVRVVTHDPLTCRIYVHKIQDKLDKKNEKGKKTSGGHLPIKSPTNQQPPHVWRSPVSEARSLFIYAAQKERVDSAVHSFKELVAQRISERELTNENLQTCNTGQITELKDAGQRHDVEVDVIPETGVVILLGDRQNMADAAAEITKLLNVQRPEYGTANYVQWCFLAVTATGLQQKAFGERQNHAIEGAFLKKEKTFQLVDRLATAYVIDFDVMKMNPVDNPRDKVNVIRQNKVTGDWARGMVTYPSTWTPQDSHYTPVGVVRIDPSSQEHREVVTDFCKTRGLHNVKVKHVDRIQNPTLYQQYAAKRSGLEKQNTGIQNERTLWHGTDAASLDNINGSGFNRSYCGRNVSAATFGDGVYFAVNSSYSLNETFSPRDQAGQRYIYQCKVLTGHHTVGRQGLKILPSRQGNVQYDSAVDDLQHPEMYIIFSDTQAYPEYLITFS